MTVGYGSEIWCLDSPVTGKFAAGWRVVAQALYRRVNTERGTLQDIDRDDSSDGGEEAAYGIDLSAYVGAVGYDTAVKAVPAIVEGEWRKDDRVADVALRAFITTGTDGTIAITLDADVVLVDEGESFDLTLIVTTGAVQLVLSEAA